eukprot:3297306-Prymnesium_polylepis.1
MEHVDARMQPARQRPPHLRPAHKELIPQRLVAPRPVVAHRSVAQDAAPPRRVGAEPGLEAPHARHVEQQHAAVDAFRLPRDCQPRRDRGVGGTGRLSASDGGRSVGRLEQHARIGARREDKLLGLRRDGDVYDALEHGVCSALVRRARRARLTARVESCSRKCAVLPGSKKVSASSNTTASTCGGSRWMSCIFSMQKRPEGVGVSVGQEPFAPRGAQRPGLKERPGPYARLVAQRYILVRPTGLQTVAQLPARRRVRRRRRRSRRLLQTRRGRCQAQGHHARAGTREVVGRPGASRPRTPRIARGRWGHSRGSASSSWQGISRRSA